MSEHVKWLLKAAQEIRAKSYAGWGNTCEDAARHVERLETRLAAAERDAERYRWLRTKAAHVVHVPWPGRIVEFDGTGAALDNAIDKAIDKARGAAEEPKP